MMQPWTVGQTGVQRFLASRNVKTAQRYMHVIVAHVQYRMLVNNNFAFGVRSKFSFSCTLIMRSHQNLVTCKCGFVY